MKIYKNKGIIYSEYFLQMLNYRLDDDNIGCSVDGFNNGREQGYIIRVHKEDERYNPENGLTFYVCANRSSDEPTFTWEDKESYAELYSEDAYCNRQITCKHIEDLVEKAIEIIENKFKGEE